MARMNKVGKAHTKIVNDPPNWFTLNEGETFVGVKYHSTIVAGAVRNSAGRLLRVMFDTGGHHTITTKRRMVQFLNEWNLPFRVYSTKGDWFIERIDIDERYAIGDLVVCGSYHRRVIDLDRPENWLTVG